MQKVVFQVQQHYTKVRWKDLFVQLKSCEQQKKDVDGCYTSEEEESQNKHGSIPYIFKFSTG